MKLTIMEANNPALIEIAQTKEISGKAAVFRVYSLAMVGTSVKGLQPLLELMQILSPVNTEYGDESTKIFDEEYAKQLSNYPASKFDLAVMLEQLQLKDEVILLSNPNHQIVGDILDSLCKYIQQKYTLQVYIVNVVEDIDEFALSEFDTDEGYEAYVKDVEWMIEQRSEMVKALKK